MTDPTQDAGHELPTGRRVRRKARPKVDPSTSEGEPTPPSNSASDKPAAPTSFGRRRTRKKRGVPVESSSAPQNVADTPSAPPSSPPQQERRSSQEEGAREGQDDRKAESREGRRGERRPRREDRASRGDDRRASREEASAKGEERSARREERSPKREERPSRREERGGDRQARSKDRREPRREGRGPRRDDRGPRRDDRGPRKETRRDDRPRRGDRQGRTRSQQGNRGGGRGGDRRQRSHAKPDTRPLRRPVDIQDAVNKDLKPTDALQLPPKALKALIAGGGTGGHVIPAIAIGEALMTRNKESRVMVLGSTRGIEADLVPKAGFELIQLPVKPIPRKLGLGYVVAGWRMVQSIGQAYQVIKNLDPDVVIGTGGYVSVAAIVAAKVARKPTLLQEQNSIPGRANRLLARFADEVHIHFTESRRYFKQREKLRLSGNPVRVKFPEGRALRTMQKYRLHTDRKTVLILGGSQGAKSVNKAFSAALKEFRGDRHIQFVIQTGKLGYRPVLNSVKHSGVRVVVKSFLHEIHELYGVADLVVARAGAMTLSELCACGLPSILVPFPYAADDHQTANALALAEKEAAVVIKDRDLTGSTLAREICRLLDDPSHLQAMSQNAYRLSRPNAARHVAEAAEFLAGASPQSILAVPDDLSQFESVEV